MIEKLNALSQRYLDQDELERRVEFDQDLEQQKETLLKVRSKLQKRLADNRNTYVLSIRIK